MTAVIPTWAQMVTESYEGSPKIQQIISEWLLSSDSQPSYSNVLGVLKFKGRIYVGESGNLRQKLMDQMHASSLGGHSSITHTYKRAKQLFYWPGMKGNIERRVKVCEVCIKNKVDGTLYAGLLQPVQIPTPARQVISMDFIEALPKSEEKDTILVVVDRLTKYAHFIALSHPYTAQEDARAFLETIYRLHGLPKGIISDRDRVFTSQVWQDFFRLLGVKLQMSTTYHPQTDG